MRFIRQWAEFVPAACVIILILSTGVIGQQAKNIHADTAKTAENTKHLKPQTTCPVSGDKIDKNQYVDYQGKRIYVCCPDCLDQVRKDPEKYIKKLETMGQSVENIGKQTGGKTPPYQSAKKMVMKGENLAGDSSNKAADAGYWTCPMHPEINKAEPGNCPICGMKLEFIKSEKDTIVMKGMDHSTQKR